MLPVFGENKQNEEEINMLILLRYGTTRKEVQAYESFLVDIDARLS